MKDIINIVTEGKSRGT